MVEQRTEDGLLKKLHDLHAPIRVPSISEYQYACGEAALMIERLRTLVKDAQREMREMERDHREDMRAAVAEERRSIETGDPYGTY